LSEKELEVIKVIGDFPEILVTSAREFSPSILANYLFSLVKSYNSFYQDSPVIKEQNEDLKLFRMQLSDLTSRILEKGMGVLGVEMPNRM
jgi:arginyl-tRNA synthetase